MSLKEERVAVADPRARAAERVLRRLGVGIKTFGLYPPHHPVASGALEKLLATLRPYLATYGSFIAQVSRHSFEIDGRTLGGESDAALALHLYTRKLSRLTILPPVTDEELASFLRVAGMDRTSLESAGGVEHLLWQSSVGNVQVIEITLEEEQEVEALGLNAFLALIGRGRLAPREREAVLDILFAADQTARLLHNIYLMAGEVFKGATEEERIDHAYQAVRTMDRLILDEPLEAQPGHYAGLTEALLLAEEPLRSALATALVARAGDDASAKFLLHQFSLERLGELIIRAVGRHPLPERLAAWLAALALPERKTAALLSWLETRIDPEASPGWLGAVIRQHQTAPAEGRSSEISPEFVFDDSLIVIPHEAFAERVAEARAITEAGATREVILTLVDLHRDESDEEELAEVAEALAGHLAWMVGQQDFTLLAAVLERLKRIAATGEEPRGRLAAGIVRRITEHPLLDQLLAALWAGRETPTEGEVRQVLAVVADEAVIPLVRVLGGEPRSGMRALLCDLLATIARDQVGALAGFIDDERWYLVRNIANILGRLQDPEVVGYLERVMGHPEYRVRREVVDALARVGTEAAQTLLVRVLDDPDSRLQLRALQALNAWGARRAMAKLLALLDAADPLHHLFQNKVAALEALERLRATEALPVLKRLARTHLAFGQHRRVLRDLARRAVQAIEGQAPQGGALSTPHA